MLSCHVSLSVCILLFFMVNEWVLTHTSTPHHETAGNDEKSYNSEILWVFQVFHALCSIFGFFLSLPFALQM